MTTHSSIFAFKIPWTEEPGGLQSTESQRDGHDALETSASREGFFVVFVLFVLFCFFSSLVPV